MTSEHSHPGSRGLADHGTRWKTTMAFFDMPKTTQYNVMNRWQYKTDTWFLQFGGSSSTKPAWEGRKDLGKMRGSYGEGTLYGIGIDSRRYEGFLKLGLSDVAVREYQYGDFGELYRSRSGFILWRP